MARDVSTLFSGCSIDVELPILGAVPKPECRTWAEVYEIDLRIGKEFFPAVKFVGHDIGWHDRGLLGHETLSHCNLVLDWPAQAVELTRV